MKILEKSRDNIEAVDLYLLTVSPAIETVKTIEDGTSIKVSEWCLFEDEKDGETTELLSFMTPEKKVFCCQSKTFKRSFFDIQSLMGNNFTIIKTSGETRNGRTFVNCILDVSTL